MCASLFGVHGFQLLSPESAEATNEPDDRAQVFTGYFPREIQIRNFG